VRRPTVRRSGVRPLDFLRESAAELSGQPVRSLLTLVGIAIGVSSVVVSVLLVTTVRFQVSDQFDARLATQVVVAPSGSDSAPGPEPESAEAPWRQDGVDRVRAIPSVTAVASTVRSQFDQVVRPNALVDPTAIPETTAVFGVDPLAVPELDGDLRGPGWSAWHAAHAERVAIVPERAAAAHGLQGVEVGDRIFISGLDFTVVGTVGPVPRLPVLETGILVPDTTLIRHFAADATTRRLLVVTQPGAAPDVAEVLAPALLPTDPAALAVSRPVSDVTLRQAVDQNLTNLGLVLGLVVAVIGSFAVANTSLASVMRRYGEFGLRRALGASPFHIGVHVLTDATLLGFGGGMIGAVAGEAIMLGVAANRHWQPVIDVRIPLLAIAVATLVGALAGAYPARVASRIEPTEALRR